MGTSITVVVTDVDVEKGGRAALAGTPLALACPIAIVAQRQLERVCFVFKYSWHLGAREVDKKREPATYGEQLPAAAVGFVKAFDAWVGALRTAVIKRDGNVDLAIEDEVVKRPRPVTLTIPLPSRPIEKKAAA